MYFIKYKPVNNLTHAGTGKTVIAAFDNRNPSENLSEYLASANQVDGVTLKRTFGKEHWEYGKGSRMGYAFISYSSKNTEDAKALNSALMNKGIKTWMAPGDIPAGSKYADVITKAIKGAECLVILLTDEAMNSIWVDKEVERALSYRKPVIPVALGVYCKI